MLLTLFCCIPRTCVLNIKFELKCYFWKSFFLFFPHFLSETMILWQNYYDKPVIFIKNFSDKHSFLIISIEWVGPRICVPVSKCQLHPCFYLFAQASWILQGLEKTHFLLITNSTADLLSASIRLEHPIQTPTPDHKST